MAIRVCIVLIYGFTLWLGLYLIRRDMRSPQLWLTGLGLVAYALALACDLLVGVAGSHAALTLVRLRWLFLVLPALCWTGALIHLLPWEVPARDRLARLWRIAVLPVVALLVLVSLGSDLIVGSVGATPHRTTVSVVLGGIVLLPLLSLVGSVWWLTRRERTRRATGVLVVVTLFLVLSTGLQVFPLGWLPRLWALLSLGVDVVCLGFAIAYFDAFDQGEALLPDMLRAFDAACLAALLFGGQVTLVIVLATGPTLPLLALLLATIAAAIAVPTFADQLASAIDDMALGRLSGVRAARADLRALASTLPRANPGLDPMTLEDVEFARLTRRALSHFGDLPRLSASPLINLPLVERRLTARGAPDDALERAIELKAVLAESVARLKPRSGGQFGTSSEWRHYNALYFPYVAGLKPYSRRAAYEHVDPVAQEALDWFRVAVPERTLYNWQTTAATLVAHDLRCRNGAAHD